jgi:hypothetical protein
MVCASTEGHPDVLRSRRGPLYDCDPCWPLRRRETAGHDERETVWAMERVEGREAH